MSGIDLADPAFEPTAGQLSTLMQRAFGDLKTRRERLDEQLRKQVLELKSKR